MLVRHALRKVSLLAFAVLVPRGPALWKDLRHDFPQWRLLVVGSERVLTPLCLIHLARMPNTGNHGPKLCSQSREATADGLA